MAETENRIAICLVCGTSGTGKTTLVERLVAKLTGEGIGVATGKHHRHAVEVDQPGKDTWRHRAAGATATFFATGGDLVTFYDGGPEVTPETLAARCPEGTRLLIIEGFKELTGYPRIEVVREGRPITAPHPSDILCVVTDLENVETFAPVYHLDDIDDISALIRRELLESNPSETSE